MPLIAERLIWMAKPLNSVAVNSLALFKSGYLTPRFSQITDSKPTEYILDDFKTYNAKKIGLVGCVVCFRNSGICHQATSEISTEKVQLTLITLENFRKYLWLLMTGLVERSLSCVWPRLYVFKIGPSPEINNLNFDANAMVLLEFP